MLKNVSKKMIISVASVALVVIITLSVLIVVGFTSAGKKEKDKQILQNDLKASFAAYQTLENDFNELKAIAEHPDAIKDLQDSLDELKVSLNTVSSKTSLNESDISTINSKISNIENTLAALQNRITELEKLVTGKKIYKLGETATIYSNGIEILQITYESKPEPDSCVFRVKNINMPGMGIRSYINALVYSTTDNTYSYHDTSIPSSVLQLNDSRSFSLTASSTKDMIYFGFPAGNGAIIPYVIFQI